MTTAQHTPMEWVFDEDDARIYYDDGNVQPTIAYVERGGVAPEQVKADGYLLAASPRMLETLNKLSSWLVCAPIASAEDMARSFPEMLQAVESAISKAKGGIA